MGTSLKTFEGLPCKNCGNTTRYLEGSKQCVYCKNQARKAWRERNKHKKHEYKYWGDIYGLKRGEAEKMLLKQNNKCLICNTSSNKWHIDHNHITGKVRGILCLSCNVLLGMSKENIDILQSAINYLKTLPD